MNFLSLDYLKSGSAVQRSVYEFLQSDGIFTLLKAYCPTLVGTFPIGIQVPGSDLDVICEVTDFDRFEAEVRAFFGEKKGFELTRLEIKNEQCIVANYFEGEFPVEIFGQNVKIEDQYAYRHMLIEHQVLSERDPQFRHDIIALKKSGMKTEPAFCQLLGLEGDPYEALLTLEE